MASQNRFYGYVGPMTESDAAAALAALGHEARLRLFRLLVRAGREGLAAGRIVALMDMPASTVAHHLGALAQAGLVRQERRGRAVLSRVDYDRMTAVLDFVAEHCCAGLAPARRPQTPQPEAPLR